MRMQTSPGEWVFLDAADAECGYGRYADDSLCNGTENAEWRLVGKGKSRRIALVATTRIGKGMPIRALYGWEYWHQPNVFSVDLMQQAFRGYVDVIACSAKYSKAWEFASCVGGETLLLDRWGGKRLHEEIPMEDQLSSSADDRSEDSTSVSSVGTVIKKRLRSTIDIALQSTSSQKRQRKITVKRVSSTGRRRGHSRSMAQKARAGRPGTAATGSIPPSAGMASVFDTDLDIRPTIAPTIASTIQHECLAIGDGVYKVDTHEVQTSTYT
jgi:hypothetical protein